MLNCATNNFYCLDGPCRIVYCPNVPRDYVQFHKINYSYKCYKLSLQLLYLTRMSNSQLVPGELFCSMWLLLTIIYRYFNYAFELALTKIEMLMRTVSYTFFPLNTERNLIKEKKCNLHNVCIQKVWRGLWKSWATRVCKTFFIGSFYI